MLIKNRNDRIWLAVNKETGDVDYSYVYYLCNEDSEWGEYARVTDSVLTKGWEFRPFVIVPDTST